MLARIFPHPVLTAGLIVIWLLLVNQIKVGSLVMAAMLGTAIPLLTEAYWPNRPRIRSLPALAGYAVLVVWDIILANIIVARIILFKPNDQIQTRWITVPLDLRTPEAIVSMLLPSRFMR